MDKLYLLACKENLIRVKKKKHNLLKKYQCKDIYIYIVFWTPEFRRLYWYTGMKILLDTSVLPPPYSTLVKIF